MFELRSPTGACALAALLISAACRGKPTTAPLTGAERDVVAEAEALQAAVCACGDRACDDGYDERVGTLLVEPPQGLTLSDGGALRWGRAVFGLMQCRATRVAQESTALFAELTDLHDAACACQDDACAFQVVADFDALYPRLEATNSSTADAQRSMELIDAMGTCLERFAPGDDDLETGSDSSGMASCDAYVAAMERYLECDKIPQKSRDAARQGIEAMRSGWANAEDFPDDVRQQMRDGCQSALDALTRGATALGCPL